MNPDISNQYECFAKQLDEHLDCFYLVGFTADGKAIAWSSEHTDLQHCALRKLMSEQFKDDELPAKVHIINGDEDETAV